MHATEFLNEAGSNKSISLLKKLTFWLSAFAGIAALVSIYFGEIREQIELTNHSDFYKFYLSSGNMLQDKPIYWPAPDRVSPTSHCNPDMDIKFSQDELDAMPEAIRLCLHPNLNPPFFIALTTPLALLDYPQALWVWSLASIIGGIWALMLIFKSEASPTTSPAIKMLIGLAFFAYFPTFASSSYGQVTLFLLLDLTLAWLALRNGKNRVAGYWLGAAASIKPFFGLFLIGFLVSRNWRAAFAFIAVCGFGFLVGGLLAGFSSYSKYIAILDNVNWLTATWNGSYMGFFTRLFGGPANKAWIDAPILVHGLSAICSFVTVGGLAAVIVKQLKVSDQKLYADVLVALTIPAMLLLSPLGWNYYFPLLLISFVVISNLAAGLPNSLTYRLLLILAAILTFLPKTFITSVYSPRVWLWDAGVYFYMLLLMFSLTAFVSLKVIKNRQSGQQNLSVFQDTSAKKYDFIEK